MKFFLKLSDDSQGILFGIIACFFASVLIAIVKYLSDDFHIFFIVMMRNFFGLLFFLPGILKDHKKVLHTKKLNLHLYRSIGGLVSTVVWFHVITIIPMSEAVSISFIIPIITIIVAVIFLKEKVHSHIWIASFIGFIGIVIILRPGFREFNPAYFYCFISMVLWVNSNILIKLMTRTERPQTIVAYMSFIMLFVSMPFAFPYLEPVNVKSLCWFILLGIVSNLLHIFVSNAYAKTDLSKVQPFDFTRLLFTAIISYFVFGEVIDIWVIIGSLVIFVGVLIAIPRKSKKQILVTVDP